MKSKLFKIKTFGCKVNQYETQAIREGLLSAGHKEADLCIVNTCTVTQKADKECRDVLRQLLKRNPNARVVAAGCYAEKDADFIREIDPRVEVIGNKEKLRITDPTISYFKDHTKAFIKVQDGCNNFCSYCKVPYVRGRSISRNPEEIIDEAKRLIGNEYKEIVLTGICLGDFGKDLDKKVTPTWLVKEISKIEVDFRIRLSSIELLDVADELIDEISSSGKLCSHLHIPLQSGDDHILKNMNRKYTVTDFLERIEYIRSIIPEIAITTDIIVGFPGETEGNFQNTLKTVKELNPSRTHIFTYNSRKGTEAFDMADNIPAKVKSIRHKELQVLTDDLAKDFRNKISKKKQRVLVETTRGKARGMLTGYTDTYVKVEIDGSDEFLGKLIITDSFK